MLHGIHCIQSGCILPGCMESMHSSRFMDSTAYNRDPLQHAAWIPLHSTWIHCPTLHPIHCTHSGCISRRCMESSAFHHAAWNPLHSIRIHWGMQHGIHYIKSVSIALHCMESPAFNQDPLGQSPCNPLHSLLMHFTLLHGLQCVQSHCMDSTAFNP